MNTQSRTAPAGRRRAVIALALASALLLPGMFAHAESYAGLSDVVDDAEIASEYDVVVLDDQVADDASSTVVDDLVAADDLDLANSPQEGEIAAASVGIAAFTTGVTGTASSAPWTFDASTGTVYVGAGTITTVGAISPWVGLGAQVTQVVFEHPVTGTGSLAGLFRDLNNLTTIVGLENLTVDDRVTSIERVFQGTHNLVDGYQAVANWDVSGVRNMTAMFANARSVQALDLSGWTLNTNVAPVNFSMLDMFLNAHSLTTVGDLSGWDVSHVTSVASMFQHARSLTSLNLSGWNLERVGSMNAMFNHMQSLTTLNLTGMQTPNVTNLNHAFANTPVLTTIYGIEGLNTANVTIMQGTFYRAASLQSVDLSAWNVDQVTTMSAMFSNANSLVSVGDLGGWNTANVTTMASMFNQTWALTNLNVTNWNTARVERMPFMFNHARSLPTLDVSGWVVDDVVDMASMFANTHSLTTIGDVSGWNTANVGTGAAPNHGSMHSMFDNATALQALDLSGWNVGNVANLANMFNMLNPEGRVSVLTTIGDVRDWDTSSVTNMQNMFRSTVFTELNLSNWDTSNVALMQEMFREARFLWRLNLRGFDTRNATNMNGMFQDAFALQQITLGTNWYALNGVSGVLLPDVPDYGQWRNVGRPAGTPEYPLGDFRLFSDELMGNILSPDEIADTWIWSPRTLIAVVFDLDGGTFNGDPSNIDLNIPEDTIVSALRVPDPVLRTDYTFAGWRYSGQLASTPNLTGLAVARWEVTEPVTFTAQWLPYYHEVTFDLAGGHLYGFPGYLDPQVHTIERGLAIQYFRVPTTYRAPHPTYGPEGFSFAGWRYDGQVDGTPNLASIEVASMVVTRDITFTAQWISPPFDLHPITFDLNGGNVGGDTSAVNEQVRHDQPIGAGRLPQPVKDGYLFLGWVLVEPSSAALTDEIAVDGVYESVLAMEASSLLSGLDVAMREAVGPKTFVAQWQSATYNCPPDQACPACPVCPTCPQCPPCDNGSGNGSGGNGGNSGGTGTGGGSNNAGGSGSSQPGAGASGSFVANQSPLPVTGGAPVAMIVTSATIVALGILLLGYRRSQRGQESHLELTQG